MLTLDIILLVIVGVAGVWGYWKGFIAQLGALGAVVVGIIACRMLGPLLVSALAPEASGVGETATRYATVAVAYALIYLVAYYAVVFAARMLRLAVKAVFLGPLDRIGGALFNIAKILILVSFLLNVAVAVCPSIDPCGRSAIGSGKPMQKIMDIAPAIVGALVPQND